MYDVWPLTYQPLLDVFVKVELKPYPLELLWPLIMVFPKSESLAKILIGFTIITPPIASPPYSKAFAPLIKLTLPAELISMFGACSIPHSWSCNLTLLVIINTLLLCNPLITGFTIELPVFIDDTPGISLIASPKLKELNFSRVSFLINDSWAVLIFLLALVVIFTSVNSSTWCSSWISVKDLTSKFTETSFDSQDTCDTIALILEVQIFLIIKLPLLSDIPYNLEPSTLI